MDEISSGREELLPPPHRHQQTLIPIKSVLAFNLRKAQTNYNKFNKKGGPFLRSCVEFQSPNNSLKK
jgi:hypothetical protein